MTIIFPLKIHNNNGICGNLNTYPQGEVKSLRGKGEESGPGLRVLKSKIKQVASLAQEESRSISENVTWGQRKRFQDGKITLPYKWFLGYERGENKDSPPVVNHEQAKLVKRIYSLFMYGQTSGSIAKLLTAEGIPTPGGKEVWHAHTIESIFSNEKYKGAARLQKKFTVDFLTKKTKRNEVHLVRALFRCAKNEWFLRVFHNQLTIRTPP